MAKAGRSGGGLPRGAPAPRGAGWLDAGELASIFAVMAEFDVAELEQVRGTGDSRVRITIRRGVRQPPEPAIGPGTVAPLATSAPSSPPRPPPPSTGAGPSSTAATEPPKLGDGGDDGTVIITSPLVGTYYRAPTPDAEPFVEVGSKIRPGQRLCIVEAMKLMNEIEAEIEGTIVEILVENGKPVEYGQRLFRVRPS